jgi:hypothetical protein
MISLGFLEDSGLGNDEDVSSPENMASDEVGQEGS